MAKILPITPNEASTMKSLYMPDGVISAWNEIIAKHWTGVHSSFDTEEILLKIKDNMNIKRADLIYANKWLEIIPIYESNGWVVSYRDNIFHFEAA